MSLLKGNSAALGTACGHATQTSDFAGHPYMIKSQTPLQHHRSAQVGSNLLVKRIVLSCSGVLSGRSKEAAFSRLATTLEEQPFRGKKWPSIDKAFACVSHLQLAFAASVVFQQEGSSDPPTEITSQHI